MTADERGESIARYLETLAERHTVKAETDLPNMHYHRGTAILYRARAADVRAGLDIADLNTGEIVT